MFDVTKDYSNPANEPVRFIAEGRDPSATIDAGLVGTPGFNNDGDNEITGIHVSNGDPGKNGILGAKDPHLWQGDGPTAGASSTPSSTVTTRPTRCFASSSAVSQLVTIHSRPRRPASGCRGRTFTG